MEIKKVKYLGILLLVFTGLSGFSQTLTKKEVTTGLTGKWKLVYENELGQIDTISLIEKRIVELKNQKGKETGYFKDGTQTTTAIKWKLVDSNK